MIPHAFWYESSKSIILPCSLSVHVMVQEVEMILMSCQHSALLVIVRARLKGRLLFTASLISNYYLLLQGCPLCYETVGGWIIVVSGLGKFY